MRFYLNITNEQLNNSCFSQIVFLAEMLAEREKKYEVNLYRAAALQAWLSGAAPDIKVFERYLAKLGLSDVNQSRLTKEEEMKKALSVIEKVSKLTNKRKKINEKVI